MAEQSQTSADLWLLDGLDDFQQHSLKLLAQNRRSIAILTRDLDAPLYNTAEFIQALSDFARTSRYAQVQILIKDTKPAAELGHKLIRLHQRLSSKIQVRKLVVEPDDKDMGFMLCDSDRLLYKNDDQVYRGFANYQAGREVKQLREQFDYVWQYGELEPEFQQLHL